MIPLTLSLRNFLSYGCPTHVIDFKPYKLICLSGKNGHGKSALLDAITWALWGQARKLAGSARSDDALLRQGCDEMLVILDFMSNHQTYRVRRTYTASGSKQHMTLDVACINEQGTVTAVLTEKTLRTTQETLERIIGIDYDGFISSAYIRQGNAHEFSKKSPKERKELIATLLDIGQYELLRTSALERMRAATLHRDTLNHSRGLLSTQASQKEYLTAHLAQVKHHIEKLSQECIKTQDALAQAQAQAQEAHLHQQLIRQQTDVLNQVYAQRKEQVMRAYTLRKHRSGIAPHDFTRLLAHAEQLEKKAQELTHQYQQYLVHVQQEQALLKEITAQEQMLKVCMESIQKFQTQLALNPDSTEYAYLQTRYTKQQQALHKLSLARQTLILNQEKLQQSRITLTQHPLSVCPLCQQCVTPDHQTYMHHWYDQQNRHIMHQRARLERVIPALKKQLQEQEKVIARLKPLVEQLPIHAHHQEQRAMFQRNLADHHTLLEQHRAQSPINPHELLTQINQQLLAVRQSLRTQAQSQTDDTDWHQLTAARVQIRQHIRALAYQIRKEQTALVAVKQAPAQVEHLQRVIQQLHEQIQGYQIQATQTEKELSAAIQASQDLAQVHDRITHAEQDIQDYQILAHAYSKDGIQALLIEQALPDIQREANAILSSLTDNQTHLIFESLKDLKSGKLKETLDIHISDHMGIRPYDLFSGGEAFRIDFALRIGLARFVSQKAGAHLQTLIIDEGFGSQDEEGLHYLMEALHAIQGSFAKIIVVSHLPHLKDQFPVHFMVHKNAQGSTVQVIQHG